MGYSFGDRCHASRRMASSVGFFASCGQQRFRAAELALVSFSWSTKVDAGRAGRCVTLSWPVHKKTWPASVRGYEWIRSLPLLGHLQCPWPQPKTRHRSRRDGPRPTAHVPHVARRFAVGFLQALVSPRCRVRIISAVATRRAPTCSSERSMRSQKSRATSPSGWQIA